MHTWMGIHRVYAEFTYGHTQVYMGIHKYTWLYTLVYMYMVVHMGIHRYTWVYTGIHGCTHGCTQVYTVYTWVYIIIACKTDEYIL